MYLEMQQKAGTSKQTPKSRIKIIKKGAKTPFQDSLYLYSPLVYKGHVCGDAIARPLGGGVKIVTGSLIPVFVFKPGRTPRFNCPVDTAEKFQAIEIFLGPSRAFILVIIEVVSAF